MVRKVHREAGSCPLRRAAVTVPPLRLRDQPVNLTASANRTAVHLQERVYPPVMFDPDSPLANPAFRRIWLAGVCGGIVRWLEIVVVGIYVFDITGSAFLASVIAMLRILPFAPAGPILAMAADRFGVRRTYLILVQMMIGLTLLQAVLAALGWLQVWHLAIGALAAGIYWAAELPLRRSLLGSVVPPSQIVAAMAIDTTSNNITKMLGPLMGGLVLQWTGLAGAFIFSTVMHVVTLRLVMQIDERKRAVPRRSGFLRNLREGIALARTNRMALLAISMSLVFNLFGFPGASMIPVVGDQQLQLSAAMVGLLTAAEGIGATLGSLVIVRYGHRIRFHGRFFAIGCIIFMLMMALFSVAPNATLAWTALLISGLGIACFTSMQATLVLIGAPEFARSRLMGLLSISIGSGPLGFLLLGWTADRVGASTALQLMVVEGLIAWSIVAWRMRDVLTKPTPDNR